MVPHHLARVLDAFIKKHKTRAHSIGKLRILGLVFEGDLHPWSVDSRSTRPGYD